MTAFKFNGCNPNIFGSYLKALGLFEIFGKKYNNVRAYWDNNVFNICLPFDSEDQIIKFFMEEYKPLPIVSPWNNGSGFIGVKKEKSELKNLININNPRLDEYKDVINKAMNIIKELDINKVNDKNKPKIVRECRNYLPLDTVRWIDTALIAVNDDLFITKILTNGGNEGNFDYSITYMRDINYIFNNLQKNSNTIIELLKNSIFNEYTDKLIKMKVGKFIPGRAGGYNEGFGFENKDFNTNPWDFIFLIHGIIFFSTGLSKKSLSNKYFVRSPFTVESSVNIESKNMVKDSVYEIWTPLWKNPAYLNEIEKMFENGRVEISNSPVSKGIEFIQAIKNYGIDRGIDKFVRYKLLNTRGQAGYVSVPVGIYDTTYVNNINIIKEINPLLNRLDMYINSLENPPKSLLELRLNIDNALEDAIIHGISIGIEKLLINIGKMEKYLSMIQHNNRVPLITGLSPAWINLNKNPSIEYIIASAISSIYNIRSYLEPIDGKKWNDSLNNYSWHGSNIYSRFTNVLYRMFIKDDNNPLNSRILIKPEYATLLINGDINADVLENILYGLMWIDWDKNKNIKYKIGKSAINGVIYTEYATIKLLYTGNKIKINGEDIQLKGNTKIISMLKANNIGNAYKTAYNAIKSRNIDIIYQDLLNQLEGTRLAAALILPVRYKSLEYLILKNIKESV